MKRTYTASVTERGQVTIPAEVRKLLGLKAHGKVRFVVDDAEDIVELQTPAFTVRTAAGSVPPLNPPLEWDEIERIMEEEIVADYLKAVREGNA